MDQDYTSQDWWTRTMPKAKTCDTHGECFIALHSAYIKSTITKFCFWTLRFQNVPRSNITRVEMFHDQHPRTVTVVCHSIWHQCFVLLPNVLIVSQTCFAILHNIVARNNIQHSTKQAKGKEKSFCTFALHLGCLFWAHGLMEEMLWHAKGMW